MLLKIKKYFTEIHANYYRNFFFLFALGLITTMFFYTLLFSQFLQNIKISFKERELPMITVSELKEQFNREEDLFLMDIREPDVFIQEHLPQAHNIPLGILWTAHNQNMIPTDKPVIVYSDDNYKSKLVLRELTMGKMFYANVKYLLDGISAWKEENYSLAGYLYPEINYLSGTELKEKLTQEDLVILDVRMAEKYAENSLVGALNISPELLSEQKEEWEQAFEIIVITDNPFETFYQMQALTDKTFFIVHDINLQEAQAEKIDMDDEQA